MLCLLCAEGAMDGDAWELSLREFRKLTPHDQVLLVIPEGTLDPEGAASTAQRVARLITAVLAPQQRKQLLVELVEEDGARHLAWLVHLFERLRLQRQVSGSTHAFGSLCFWACFAQLCLLKVPEYSVPSHVH